MTKLDVVGFGALNLDRLFRVNKIVLGEEEGIITGYSESCGGSAANTIVSLARLKCKTGFVGKVASDREGKLLCKDLRNENVNTEHVIQVKEGRTGTVIGFVDDEGQRALYVDSGVNDTITAKEAGTKHDCRFLHLSSFVGARSFETQKKLAQSLSERIKISLDPGMIYAEKGVKALEPLISNSFVMFPTEKELNTLFPNCGYEKSAKLLLEMGVRIVAVKLGSRGSFVADNKQTFQINALETKVADTTGAGDAFDAGFLFGLLNERNLQDCGRIGNYVASRCIMKSGTRAGLPVLADLHRAGLA